MVHLPVSRIGPPHLPALRCGEIEAAVTIDQPRIVTGEYATVWMLRGVAEHTDAQGRRHRIIAGDAFHRFPEQLHAVHFGAGSQFLYLALPGPGHAFLRSLGMAAIDDPVIHPGLQPDLARRWRGLIRAMRAARHDDLASVAVRGLELILELHRHADVRGDPRMAERMQLAAARLAEQGTASQRQPALARSLGMSYRTFRRAFTAFAGESPDAYRLRCRLDAVQHLLRTSGLPIAVIAERLGYRDGADLARQFRKRLGCSPSAYRRTSPW